MKRYFYVTFYIRIQIEQFASYSYETNLYSIYVMLDTKKYKYINHLKFVKIIEDDLIIKDGIEKISIVSINEMKKSEMIYFREGMKTKIKEYTE